MPRCKFTISLPLLVIYGSVLTDRYQVGKGERLLKDIYESLRAGPGWNETLLWVGYDDAGGFYDHVVPPHEGVPDPEHPCHVAPVCSNISQPLHQPPPCERPPCTNGTNGTALVAKFDFKRLGMRSAAMLISPWIPKGVVFQEPQQGPKTSQFEHSSIPATIRDLFGLPTSLTKRDAWAGSFTELLTLDQPRTDAPMHLPLAPGEATPPPLPLPKGLKPFLKGKLCVDQGEILGSEREQVRNRPPKSA